MGLEEKVLCIRTGRLANGVGSFTGLSVRVDDVKAVLNRDLSMGSCQYLRRSECEHDPNWQQIIPYVVVFAPPHDRVLSYTRGAKGEETRLRGRRSIGFGGHVSQELDDCGGLKVGELIRACVKRELSEEIALPEASLGPGFYCGSVGLLRDCTDVVGNVHLGVVVAATIGREQIPFSNDTNAGDFRWLKRRELFRDYNRSDEEDIKFLDGFEGWSRILITSGPVLFQAGLLPKIEDPWECRL